MNIYKTTPIGELVKGNPYVGRGIVIGKTSDGENAVSAYFIMGRSENSRNRIFAIENGDVYADNITLKHHVHGGVDPGPGRTGEAQ